MRADDPESALAIDRLIDDLPDYVESTDRDGEIAPALLDAVGAGCANRFIIPVEYGGSPLTATALRRTTIFERIGAACAGICIGLPGPGLSMPPVLALATREQRAAYFARFVEASGPMWGAFAISEPGTGSDATALRTTARQDGDGYVLDGEKCFITNGGRAELVVVFASVDLKRGRFGIRAFLVERGTPGFVHLRNEDMLGLRGSQLAQLSFSDCKVPASAMLGHDGVRGPVVDAFTGAQSAWDYMRPVLTSVIVGACLGALERAQACLAHDARSHLSRGEHAVMSDTLASYRHRLAAARLLAYRAAWRYDSGQRASLDASMAKAYASTLSMQLAHALMRMFAFAPPGSASDFSKFYRDAKAFDILEGSGDMQRLMIARAYQGGQRA